MTEKRISPRKLTRKQFLQLSAAGAAAGLLTGCQAMPTNPPAATNTALPSTPATHATATATPTSIPTRKPPETPSRVVHTAGAGVWDGDTLSPAVLRRMLDASVTKLTGVSDAHGAWAKLFSPTDRIAIKVNTFRNSLIWTHVPLVTAVTDCLVEAGVPAGQITLTDYYTLELETAGFTSNRDGEGVRCYGADSDYQDKVAIDGANVQLNPVIAGCTALINMPVLKSHMITGLTFALKNHFGSVSIPSALHTQPWSKMAALNALPEIKDRTRLVIGDILEANLEYSNSYPYWKADYRGDSILMSLDPVAHDKVGLDLLTAYLAEKGVSTIPLLEEAKRCLESAAALGLGTNLTEYIEVVETSA
jgi:hypothetical protein